MRRRTSANVIVPLLSATVIGGGVAVFDKLLDRVGFDDVVAFCRQFPEGVRVEYKREPVQIDKIVASLANTLGGFFVIGIRTDEKNMPVLPIEGMQKRQGIEEQIVQIAQTAIYPALTPAVRVLAVPGNADRLVAVVKVAESIDAPHAVDDAAVPLISFVGASACATAIPKSPRRIPLSGAANKFDGFTSR